MPETPDQPVMDPPPPVEAHSPPLGILLITTWGGSGLIKKAPGTWGSAAALPFAWLIVSWFGPWGLAAATVAVFLLGWWASNVHMRVSKEVDPGRIVIDEVAGQWLTLLPVAANPLAYAIGFLAFRIADIVKIWPANVADRHIKGGLGVMVDDIVAALWSGGLLLVLVWLGWLPASW